MMMSLESRQRPAPVSVPRAVSIAAALLSLCSAAMPAPPEQHHDQAGSDTVSKAHLQLDAVSELAQAPSSPLKNPAAEAAGAAAHRSGNIPHHRGLGMLLDTAQYCAVCVGLVPRRRASIIALTLARLLIS